MKINLLILLLLAILFLNNCAATHKMELTAVASPDQKTDFYGAVIIKGGNNEKGQINLQALKQYKKRGIPPHFLILLKLTEIFTYCG